MKKFLVLILIGFLFLGCNNVPGSDTTGGGNNDPVSDTTGGGNNDLGSDTTDGGNNVSWTYVNKVDT